MKIGKGLRKISNNDVITCLFIYVLLAVAFCLIHAIEMEVDGETLANQVQEYSVLYDKSHADFHRKDIRKNAWNAIAKDLGLEDGDMAEKFKTQHYIVSF